MSDSLEKECWDSIDAGNYRRARLYLRHGAKADRILDDGNAVIHILSGKEGIEATQLLRECLDQGASPNVQSNEGITPVHLAAIWGLHDNLCTLLEYGGDPKSRDFDGSTALDYACQSNESQADRCVQKLKDVVMFNNHKEHDKEHGWSPSTETEFFYSNPNVSKGNNSIDLRDLMTEDESSFDSTMNISTSSFYTDCQGDSSIMCQSNESRVDRCVQEVHKEYDKQLYGDLCETIDSDDDETAHAFTCVKEKHQLLPSGQTVPSHSHTQYKQKMEENSYLDNTRDISDSFLQDMNKVGWSPRTRTNCYSNPNVSKRNNVTDVRVWMTDDESSFNSTRSANTSTSSFYTADEGDFSIACTGDLDDSAISFPKLHPWSVQNNQEMDLDDTLVDTFCSMGIKNTSDSFESTNIINTSANATLCDGTVLYDWREYSVLEIPTDDTDSTISIPNQMLTMDCHKIREELLTLGDDPGPIRADTRMLYIRRLVRLKRGLVDSKPSDGLKGFLPEIKAVIEGTIPSPEMDPVEESMCVEFTQAKLRPNWREGTEKSSFNYLLLDSRVTQNLPLRSKKMVYEDIFHTFVAGVFYVGKGKRSRPYAHLHEAVNLNKVNRKLQQIRDIWTAGLGVVSLHCFQGVIPVEAYTREACMVEALGLTRLTNQKKCDYYGRAKLWSVKKKRQMGVFLLKRALQIFLNEGEREMRPEDLRKS